LLDNPVIFLFVATGIAAVSYTINSFLVGTKLTSDKVFWVVWLILIWSAEVVSNSSLIYYPFPVTPVIRSLVLLMFTWIGLGFLLGSLLAVGCKNVNYSFSADRKISQFIDLYKNRFAIFILFVGIAEFSFNFLRSGNLFDLRADAFESGFQIPQALLQLSYFAFAFLVFLGIADGKRGKMSLPAAMTLFLGLTFHNLAVGGRINVVLAPILYVVPLILSAQANPTWRSGFRSDILRFLSVLLIVIMTGFSLIGVARSFLGRNLGLKFGDIFWDVVFSFPRYISDTLVAVEIHVSYAKMSDVPFGYFTFDAVYRVFDRMLGIDRAQYSNAFGHEYFRADGMSFVPWGWTQTNLIPRLIADFGSGFLFAVFALGVVVQFLSIYTFRVAFVGIALRSLMVFGSAYSILGLVWFSAFNSYVIFYCTLIYLLAKVRINFS
jgi:hypothetical protein